MATREVSEEAKVTSGAQSINRVRTAALGVVLSEEASHETPPVELPALVDWLWRYAKPPHIDYENKAIRDGWNREIRLIVQDGRLQGFGSAGRDGIWEDGQGDDITAMLDEVRAERRQARGSGPPSGAR